MQKERKEITALTKTYDLLLWIIPQLEKFPKSQRFLLGDRIETIVLDIMDLIIEAVYTKDKSSLLKKANLEIEKSRYLIRLAKDLKYLSLKPWKVDTGIAQGASPGLNEIKFQPWKGESI